MHDFPTLVSRFKFQDSVCNGCHDLIILSVNMNDIAITTIKNIDFVLLLIALVNLKQLIY